MKISQRKRFPQSVERGSARVILISSISAILLLAGFVIWQSRPSRMVEKKHASLVDGIERRSPARIERLVAENYTDRWGFDRNDAVEAIVDVGSQFMVLVVTEEEKTTVLGDGEATVSSKLIFGGKPIGPVANEVMRRLNGLDEPFVFTWKKESFLPASWRLVKMENASLPDDLWGYSPGDIRRAMQGDSDL